MNSDHDLLEALPVAVYTTDVDGRITFYNRAAAELWGHRPALGTSYWCGSWRLYRRDGRPLPHDECPMAVTLIQGREVRGAEAVLERPDGTRVPFQPYPTLLRDEAGRVTGAMNMLLDLTDRDEKDLATARLAAIVEGSNDAIVSKTLDGLITSWNAGASRIFGYTADEMIGQSITRIIPPELYEQESDILARLRRGERIDHFDTVRLTKDGRRIEVSLTVSPVRDRTGTIVGASKVGRDISERKRAEETQTLLTEELNHRVKNTLATIQAIASQSLRRAASPDAFVSGFNGRVQALARAHDLLVNSRMKGGDLSMILRDQVLLGAGPDPRISCSGPSVMLDARAAVHMSLVLHELATNARKYGALSRPEGRLSIGWTVQATGERELSLTWKESGVPDVRAPASFGFGTTLIERTLRSNGGEASTNYEAGGITCHIRLPLSDDKAASLGPRASQGENDAEAAADARSRLEGKRILLVEDEPLVAMDIEAELVAAGCEIVGPAESVEAAKRLIGSTPCDAALLDANLAGDPVDEVAAALVRRGIPFAFATGYGRGALPPAFREAAILAKPFHRNQLVAVLEGLLSSGPASPNVVRLQDGKSPG